MGDSADDFVIVSVTNTPLRAAPHLDGFDTCNVAQSTVSCESLGCQGNAPFGTPNTTAACMSTSVLPTCTVAALGGSGGVTLLPQRWDGEIPSRADLHETVSDTDTLSEELKYVGKAVATCIARAGCAAFGYAASLLDGAHSDNQSLNTFVPTMLHVDGFVPLMSHDVTDVSSADSDVETDNEGMSHHEFLVGHYLRAMEGGETERQSPASRRFSKCSSDFDFADA